VSPPDAERRPRQAPSETLISTAPTAIKLNGISTKAGSLDFIQAGALARVAIGRAMDADLSALEMRVFVAVLDRTVTYSKAADRTSTRNIATIVYGVTHDEVTGWQRRNVSNALRELAKRGVITYEPSIGRRHALSSPSLLKVRHLTPL